MTIEAKTEFFRATSKEQRESLSNVLSFPETRLALVFVMAKLGESGSTAEQMLGAKMFRTELLDLAEPIPDKPSFPEKRLNTLG